MFNRSIAFILLILVGFLWLMCCSAQAASTETCPTVENGVWWEEGITPLSNSQEWNYQGDHSNVCVIEHLKYFDVNAILWRKIPYKIEWRRFDKDYLIGFREDGLCIWKKEVDEKWESQHIIIIPYGRYNDCPGCVIAK